MIDERLLKSEERAVYSLRSLYKSFGYAPFKMGKFEEYELYVRNKDFLVSDRIITFNDTNGKLLALKPDVTLSIIKSGEDSPGRKQKFYYNENVYRVSGSTHQFKEIMQAGLECIGDLDAYDIFEVLQLAARSLELISSEYVLEISHLGILTALLNGISEDENVRSRISECIAAKNAHDLRRICAENGVNREKTEELCGFVGIYGGIDKTLAQLREICESDSAVAALDELRELCALLKAAGLADRVQLDFSIVNDMNYYNGIVFKGFLSGICEGVLAGGQYDKLMRKMGRRSKAIGFAIYLDLLEGLDAAAPQFDVDVLLLYDAKQDIAEVAAKARELAAAGKSVSVQRELPPMLRYKELCDMTGGGADA